MAFLEVFLFLILVLVVTGIIRWAVKKFRRAGVVGTMGEIVEAQEAADAIRRFRRDHPDASVEKDRAEVSKFKK